ncbi:ankyrin repeat domain-containing protein [Nonomuraea sp. FMUSA5-5]|uniref:Ankyrin repeat domain-containing protein n=1 Tax=Nonomuraea composti TaxID=2720023 RepID=A0ABX1AY83_9ACTN|nr:ankyrin repeat domain-containing protein [Nonomuraea sp. FMUSA5-5]NJP88531.1 ankyrin repeat domain-containing protein [Nonomuraea sp. FMUSA5-5]
MPERHPERRSERDPEHHSERQPEHRSGRQPEHHLGRHFELPARPSLEYYRKQAKQLRRAYAAGDPAAVARAVDVLGDRAGGRFLLSDAQFVLAQEHGFRTWAEFRGHVEGDGGGADRPVSRLMGVRPGIYDSMAATLLAELRRGDPGALRRLRAYVPRHADTPPGALPGHADTTPATVPSDTGTTAGQASGVGVELRDARLVIARELGFPTWQELVSYTEKSRRELGERREARRRLRREVEALLAGDVERLATLTAGQADILLQMLAGPEPFPGVRLGKELGVPRAAAEVLVGKATDLDLPLVQAARSGRVACVRLLLDAGADAGVRKWGATPLEHAVYHGHTEAVDLLAERAIVPGALWTYAACGRLDLVRGCFGVDGGLLPGAATARPDLADTGAGFPSRLPPTGDPEEIVGEAFVHACQHGRVEVVRWLLDRGVRPDVAPYLGRTGLHWAILGGRLGVARLLLERGADPSVRDDLLRLDASGWLGIAYPARPDDPVAQRLRDLLGARAHGGFAN